MKKNKISNLVEDRIKKIHKHYDKLQEDFAEEELHDYRLEIKRLKAFLELLNTNRPIIEQVTIGKKARDLYNLTGELRNLQLHRKRITELQQSFDLPAAYLSLLDNHRIAAMDEFRSLAEDFSFHRFHEKILGFCPGHLDDYDCRLYMLNQWSLFASYFYQDDYNDEDLHEMRRLVKHTSYNIEFLAPFLPFVFPAFLTDKKQSEDLAERLGEFHDLCISVEYLQPPLINEVKEPAEISLLITVRSLLIREKQKLKDELSALLSTLKNELENKMQGQPANAII
jgi:CHAD domain-containing protein